MKKIGVLLVAFLLVFSQVSYAGWIDDWIAQKTSSGANYFSTQKRGFASAGSFSARWPMSNDYLMNITPPSYHMGCGGIDLFGGGVSFMNANYLVKKLQNMINAAPAIAFNMALCTVSEQLCNSLKEFEGITDRLNQLQLDDCKASKAIAATVLNGAASSWGSNMFQQQQSEAWTNFGTSLGGGFFDKVTDDANSAGSIDQAMKNLTGSVTATSPSTGTATNQMVAGCPASIIQVFFSPGSILQNILTLNNLNPSYAPLLRGYIGDILIDNTGTNYISVPFCSKDTPDRIEGLVDGNVDTRAIGWSNGQPAPGQCLPLTSVSIGGHTYSDVEAWINSVLEGIVTNMSQRQPLTAEQTNFIQTMPAPLYQSIKTAIQEEGHNVNAPVIAQMYTPVVSAAYAFAMITDLYNTIRAAINTGSIVMSNTKGAQSSTNQNKCHMELAQQALDRLIKMDRSLADYVAASQRLYSSRLSELVTSMQYGDSNNSAQDIINRSVARAFPGYSGGVLQ